MANQRKMTRKEFLIASAGMAVAGFSDMRRGISQSASGTVFPLGKTGLKVSPLCFGTGRTQDPVLVKTVLDKGITLFDTARSYAGGQNEVVLGKALKEAGGRAAIQTKIRARLRDADLNASGVSGSILKQLDSALEMSLKALQTDTIDILLYHWVTSAELLYHDAVLEFFTSARKAGKIKACGFSTHNDRMDVLERATKAFFYEVIMVPYNYRGSYVHSISKMYYEWDQQRLETLLKTLHSQGVGILAMKTCSAGPMPGGEQHDPSYKEAIKWVLNRPFIDCANVAMGDFDQIEEDIGAME